MESDALFLDFDGVVCDSVRECFVSSWIAFHERYRGDKPNAISTRDFRAFVDHRPFTRNGKDYVLIQEFIADGLRASSQAEFDDLISRAGEEKMGTYDSLLYQVRENLLATDPDYWLRLHRPFGGIARGLESAARSRSVWIVSTKRPAYILRILEGWGIAWSADRVVLPVGETKLDVIHRIMGENGYSTGMFIDDQPDHLRCRDGMGVGCYFANWAHGIELPAGSTAWNMDLDDFVALLEGVK